MLMLQYKMLELGMDEELQNIAKVQEEIETLKAEDAGDDEKAEEKEAAEGEEVAVESKEEWRGLMCGIRS